MLGTGQDRRGVCPLVSCAPGFLSSPSSFQLRQTQGFAPQFGSEEAALFPEHPRSPACLWGHRQLTSLPLVLVWAGEGGWGLVLQLRVESRIYPHPENNPTSGSLKHLPFLGQEL